MIASKFYEDFYISNEMWSQIAGIPLAELNRLERNFLEIIDFDIIPDVNSFITYVQLLLSYAVERQLIDQQTADTIMNLLVQLITDEIRDSVFE